MNINFLKFRKKIVSLEDINSDIFNDKKYWIMFLVFCFVLLVFLFVFSAKLFFYVYKEEYRKNEDVILDKIINIERINNLVKKREDFVNKIIPNIPEPNLIIKN